MLTYPSDPLPQIVCPMDEDAIPPNRFCSAPPHSEPPPPLPPFSSITPSSANDGISGHRRIGRIQEVRTRIPRKQSNTDSGAAQKPSRQNPSPSERHQESESMVEASQCEQPRVESTHGNESQSEDGFDFSCVAECQNEQKDQKTPWDKTSVSAAEDVVEQFSDNTTHSLDTVQSDMDTCGRLAVGHTLENASVPKGWVISPFFQSFKSKMACFTEIVMSPVKLFRAHSPPLSMDHPDKLEECELQADETSDVEHSKRSNTFHPEAQCENGNQGAKAEQQRPSAAEDAKNVAINYSKRLSFDVEADECAISQEEKNITDSVPLQHSPLRCIVSEDVSESVGPVLAPVLLQPSVDDVSASHESNLKMSSARVKQKGKLRVELKPLPRKHTGNRKKVHPVASDAKKKESAPEVMDEQVSPMDSVKSDDSSDADKMLPLCFAQPDSDYGQKMDDCHLAGQNLRDNLKDSANGRTLQPNLAVQQPESPQEPETYLAADLGRAKRQLNLDCHSQHLKKKKRLTVDLCRMEIKKQELLNVASDREALRGLRPPRKEVVSTNTVADGEERRRPARKRQAGSARTNKGKSEQEMLIALSESVLNAQTGSSCDPMVVCSLDKRDGVSEDKQKSSSKAKPSGSGKRPKTRTVLGHPDVNIDNRMALETTIAITSTKQAEEEELSEVFVRPDMKQLQSTRTCREVNKKPRKRKSPNQASSNTESDSTAVSTSSAQPVEPLEVTPTDMNTPEHVQKEGSRKHGLKQPSKRPKKGLRVAVKSSAASGSQETEQCVHDLHLITKENPSEEDESKVSTDPVYFEMTPSESNRQPSPPSSQPSSDCYVQLNNEVKHLSHEKERDTVGDEASPGEFGNHSSINVSRPRSRARRVNVKPRPADNQRRKCRVLHSSIRKGEEVTKSITVDNADLATAGTGSSEKGSSSGLLRSYSCPEIPSLRSSDTPWNSLHSPHHSRVHSSHQHQFSYPPLSHHTQKSLRRARRHTVCSVEVEREIAPLCLRKEVYPSRRSVPYDGLSQNLCPGLALSTSSSLSPLASRFLSSPLAFLSKKADSRGAAAGPGASSHVSSPTSGFLQRTDSSTASSSSSGIPLECEIERRRQSEEEDDGENTSSSSQEYEDVVLREEKALSDSEIKVVRKHEERGKVSSIRIRKTLPKPQNNLTPMGLPKPVRLKKKEFSLEEIYTNKNFSKPPESRLETIFEVPLNRRNGSESWFGQRRLKRFLEFLEVGEARKPKKPLVGVGKAGTSSSRTRRGGFPKDEPSVSVQDVDSLLCAKLDQLNLWLMHDQTDS